jgi:DNA-binding MarR family transcriptional regulator
MLGGRFRALDLQSGRDPEFVNSTEGFMAPRTDPVPAEARERIRRRARMRMLFRHAVALIDHVSSLVRSLQAAGLTLDWRDAGDRRQVRLAVTDTGWALLERLGARQEQALREFVAELDRAEIQDIIADISARYLGLGGSDLAGG